MKKRQRKKRNRPSKLINGRWRKISWARLKRDLRKLPRDFWDNCTLASIEMGRWISKVLDREITKLDAK